MEMDVETTVAALSLLAAPYTALNQNLREEFVRAMALRYRLDESQQAWCGELLGDERSLGRDAGSVVAAAGGLGADDCGFLWNVVSCFLSDVAPKLALLEEMGGLGYVPEEGQMLFPREIQEAFNLVGVGPTFNEAAVTKAYYQTMRLIHPDPARASGLSEVEVARAEALSKETIEARKRIVQFYRDYSAI